MGAITAEFLSHTKNGCPISRGLSSIVARALCRLGQSFARGFPWTPWSARAKPPRRQPPRPSRCPPRNSRKQTRPTALLSSPRKSSQRPHLHGTIFVGCSARFGALHRAEPRFALHLAQIGSLFNGEKAQDPGAACCCRCRHHKKTKENAAARCAAATGAPAAAHFLCFAERRELVASVMPLPP